MSLDEAIEKHTHRQMRTWSARFQQKMDEPSQESWYLMQVAREVARVLAKHPDRIETNQFKLGFTTSRQEPTEQQVDVVSAIGKEKWGRAQRRSKTDKARSANRRARGQQASKEK